jgi:hypothetical protein
VTRADRPDELLEALPLLIMEVGDPPPVLRPRCDSSPLRYSAACRFRSVPTRVSTYGTMNVSSRGEGSHNKSGVTAAWFNISCKRDGNRWSPASTPLEEIRAASQCRRTG